MKVIEHIEKADSTLISFEIIPLKRGGKLENLLVIMDDLKKFNPPFIDVTSHAAEVEYQEKAEGIKKKVKRKRPGTLGICALIQHKYNIDAVPHLLCTGFTREETEDVLIDFRYLGIENVFVIRGDERVYKKPRQEGKTINLHASNLVNQVSDMNKGQYLEEMLDTDASSFCIGVAGYPEKHFEAPNMETDIQFLKEKVMAGANYIVTQMLFNNQYYFQFVDQCNKQSITVPIIPGIKIITRKQQLYNIPKTFHIDIPYELSQEIYEAKPEHVQEIGINWAAKQAEELINRNVPAVHFYIMGSSEPIKQVMKKLG